MVGTSKLEQRRRARVRRQIRKSANGRPRLSVFRSNKYIYAQVIDDLSGKTVAAASSREVRRRRSKPGSRRRGRQAGRQAR